MFNALAASCTVQQLTTMRERLLEELAVLQDEWLIPTRSRNWTRPSSSAVDEWPE
jgi:hypothetical protein